VFKELYGFLRRSNYRFKIEIVSASPQRTSQKLTAHNVGLQEKNPD
jgi:hypothetical protein